METTLKVKTFARTFQICRRRDEELSGIFAGQLWRQRMATMPLYSEM